VILLLPVGAEAESPRTPRVTLSIAGACVLGLLLTWDASRSATGPAEPSLERVAAWTLLQESESQPGLRERVAAFPSALAFLQADPGWRQLPLPEDRRARLEHLLEEHQRIVREHPFHRFGLVPGRLGLAGLLGHMFLHSDVFHLAFNMLFLWVVGGALEAHWGGLRFGALYLLTGLCAAGAHCLSDPRSLEPAIGSSGAVAGAMGAFALAHARQGLRVALVMMLAFAPRIQFHVLPAWLVLGAWALEQLFYASFGAALGVAVWAHLGGFAAGGVAGLLLRAGLLGEPAG
jgi:membrane associated rhomboid family serine protease